MEHEPKPRSEVPELRPQARGTYAGGLGAPVPKVVSYRDAALLDMASGRPCMLLVPGICNHRLDTTVACHQNEGKGMGIKAPDDHSVWGCAACHEWYDRSTAPRRQKRMAFLGAHSRQVLAWRVVAQSPSEDERFRRAARRALDHLGASPLPGEMP